MINLQEATVLQDEEWYCFFPTEQVTFPVAAETSTINRQSDRPLLTVSISYHSELFLRISANLLFGNTAFTENAHVSYLRENHRESL